MEPIITPELLATTGIAIPEEQVSPLLDHLNELLDERVGTAIVESLSDEQIDELASLQETASEDDIQTWMESHVQDMPAIVQDEIDILLGETAEHAEALSA